MNRVTLAAAAALVAAGAAEARSLPGTLNFDNVTAGRIASTESETSANEKEVEFGDFDNDRDLDVVIAVAYSDFGQRKNKLYRNDGGVFNEISSTVPLFTSGDVARNAFFRDYDGDGWLDIIVVCDNNSAGNAGRTKLWINRIGTLTPWLEEGGVRLGPSTGGAACGGVSINNDNGSGFDLNVGNYPGPSQDTMYVNDGAGFFTAVTATHLPTDSDYTVDVAAGDMNGDGKTDLLISNWGTSYIYYNDNMGQGSGIGDYRYGAGDVAGKQNIGNAGANENAMEAGDFDNDNDLDFYWSNFVGATGDRIVRNDGNDANNKMIPVFLDVLPSSVTTLVSRKATVVDLNGDGRVDILVMKGGGRPTILRNTTVNGEISFVDWTPGDAFPAGSPHQGWHSAVFDSNGDGDPDIFLGGWSGDHLFEQVPANEVDEDVVAGALPALYNLDPVAVVGHGATGDVDEYAFAVGGTSFVSMVLNGPGDYLLELVNSGNTVVATSSRGGLGVEEALQATTAIGNYKARVTVIHGGPAATDINGDGGIDVLDLIDLLLCFGQRAVPGCEAEDVNGDGSVDVLDLIDLLLEFGAPVSNDYVLEVLSRSG